MRNNLTDLNKSWIDRRWLKIPRRKVSNLLQMDRKCSENRNIHGLKSLANLLTLLYREIGSMKSGDYMIHVSWGS